MNLCDSSRHLSAYMDGEMSSGDQAILTAHLAQCPSCQAELDALRQVVALLKPHSPTLSAPALRALHTGVDTWRRRSPARLAGVLSAMAACLAVASVLSLMRTKDVAPATLPWETASVQAIDDSTNTNSKEVAVAEWMVADLSHGGAHGE